MTFIRRYKKMFKYKNTPSPSFFIFILNFLLICALMCEGVDGALKCSMPNSEEYVCDNVPPDDPECCCFSVICNEDINNTTSKGCAPTLEEAASVASDQCKVGGMEFATSKEKIMLCKGDMCNAWYPWAKTTTARPTNIDLYIKELKKFAWETDIDCQRILNGDEKYVKERVGNRVSRNESIWPIFMNCDDIKFRMKLNETIVTTEEEKKFPLAFQRNVYKDYMLLEMEFAISYRPHNWYCYALDAKSSDLFHARMKSLAACFPNVELAKKEYIMDSRGHNISESVMECMHQLAKPEKKWKYLIIVQNHAIQTKTNAEIVQILKWLDGSNDIELSLLDSYTRNRLNAFKNLPWDFKSLHLFNNESKNDRKKKVFIGKGYAVGSVTREFVNFVTTELNLTIMFEHFHKGDVMDEHWLQALHYTDAVNAPGGFTQQCYDSRNGNWGSKYFTRHTLWSHSDSEKCQSKEWRHNICILGIEDLSVNVKKIKEIYINKMMPGFDFEAIYCWNQWMRNRTKLGQEAVKDLNPKEYANLPQTLYVQKKRKNNGMVKDFDPKTDCWED